jgi:S-adenosylmethionine synthetase
MEAGGLVGAAAGFAPDKLILNGAGEFAIGGPEGDNGLSGKKLVIDHYGPGVPIGGGALCGKDPHKVDKCGALRARQLAKNWCAKESTKPV